MVWLGISSIEYFFCVYNNQAPWMDQANCFIGNVYDGQKGLLVKHASFLFAGVALFLWCAFLGLSTSWHSHSDPQVVSFMTTHKPQLIYQSILGVLSCLAFLINSFTFVPIKYRPESPFYVFIPVLAALYALSFRPFFQISPPHTLNHTRPNLLSHSPVRNTTRRNTRRVINRS